MARHIITLDLTDEQEAMIDQVRKYDIAHGICLRKNEEIASLAMCGIKGFVESDLFANINNQI